MLPARHAVACTTMDLADDEARPGRRRMNDTVPQPRVKRVYEPAEAADGFRVLVDRLWPRGLTHEQAAIDLWLKEIAPSADLRTAWHHDPDRSDEFADRYRAELDHSPAVEQLVAVLREHPVVTLVHASRDPRVNHATVLRALLESVPLARGGDAA